MALEYRLTYEQDFGAVPKRWSPMVRPIEGEDDLQIVQEHLAAFKANPEYRNVRLEKREVTSWEPA